MLLFATVMSEECCSGFPSIREIGGKSDNFFQSVVVTKLTKLFLCFGFQDAARVRRHRFQQKPRDDWRARTAPVTEEELYAVE